MRVWIPTAVALAVATVLQAALAPHMAIMGVTPNFILLVIVTLAMVEGPTPGAVAGFAGGLMFDMLGSGPIGPGALVLTAVGYLAGSLARNMFSESWVMPVTVVAIASVVTELAYGALLAFIGAENQSILSIVMTIVLPTALYNTLLALLVYPWLASFLRRESEMTELRGLS